MGDAVLPSIIIALTIVAVMSAAILVRAAILRPHVGALTERAILAVVLAVFGVIYSTIALTTEFGWALFSQADGRAAVRMGVVALLSIPGFWTFLYLTGRLR